MGTPASWTNTATLYASSGQYANYITKAEDYWLALGINTSTNVVSVFYASDPRAASWTKVDLSTWTANGFPIQGLYYFNSNYVCASVGATSFPVSDKYEIHYASAPSGTWTDISLTAVNGYGLRDMSSANGYLVMCGVDTGGNGCIYYASDHTGTWTAATIGASTYIVSVAYEDGYYYALGRTSSFAAELWRCSTLNGTWTSYHVFTGFYLADRTVQLQKRGAYWTTILKDSTSSLTDFVVYATTLAGSWSTRDVGTDLSSGAWGLAYGDGWWVTGGFVSGSNYRIGYSQNTVPSSAFSTATTVSGREFDVAYADREFVVTNGSGIYCMTGGPLPAPTTGPTFLRQHQSPVMTPSRVRGVDLRQSQTPRITR